MAILFAALLPIVVLIFYIYFKDRNAPEPTGQIVKAFFYGMLSVPLSLCMSIPLGWIGAYPAEATNILGSINTAFFGAAIPEEVAKLFVLWLVLRKNPYFDEKMDGIVYAVCVSLGFAALENIMYLYSNAEAYLTVGIARAIFAVPGHFCFGILMGYYYSLAKFYIQSSVKNAALVLIAPIVVHGIYDSILFIIDVTPAISGVLTIVFLWFCHRMWKYGSMKIKELLNEIVI
jgi:RsiW-degrading membrane proteinase PrsW (M82 family)